MDIEHVAGISLAPRRLAREESDFTVGGGVLCHVVDDNKRVLAAITEVFRHRETGKGGDPLQTRSSRRTRNDKDAAFGCAVSLNCVDDSLDRGRLLTDCDVDTDNVAGLLIDDAVDGNCRLADGAVPEDQLALSAPQGKHGIEDEQAGLDGFAHEIAVDDRGGWTLHGFAAFGLDRPATVEWAPQRIDGAAEQGWPYRNAYYFASAADPVSRFDSFGLVEQNASENVAVQGLVLLTDDGWIEQNRRRAQGIDGGIHAFGGH
jgi:hypothetical protein